MLQKRNIGPTHIARRINKRLDLLAQLAQLLRMPRELVQSPAQRHGSRIAAPDDDQPRVAVEHQSLLRSGRSSVQRGEQRGADVGDRQVHAHACVEPLAAERLEGPPVARQPGDFEQDEVQPRREEEADVAQRGVQEGDSRVLVAGGEAVEAAAEGEVAHDVEGVQVDPLADVDGLARRQLGDELLLVGLDALLVAADHPVAERGGPGPPAGVVLLGVAAVLQGTRRVRQVVPGAFRAGGLGAVDGGHGGRVDDGEVGGAGAHDWAILAV